MTHSDEITRLLTEIRDMQREHSLEYQRVTARSIELQQEAVDRQKRVMGLFRGFLAVTFCLIALVLILIVYLLTKVR